MKHVKQLASLLLAAALLISMATVALADGTNTITVNKAEPGATYKIYKMMSLTNSGANYAYKVESGWQAFFRAADAEKGITAGPGADYVTIDDNGYVTWNTGKDAANLAPLAVQYVTDNSTTVTAANTIIATKPTTGDCKVEFTGLESGYYLITSTNGTKAIIASTPTNKTEFITEKNTNPTTGKEVQEDSDSTWGSANSAQIGDTVNFKATVTIRPGAVNYVMHDVMADGLTFDASSVKVYTTWTAPGAQNNVELPGGNYTVTASPSDSCTFEVKFADTYLATITAETKLTVTYTAVLNANAVPGTAELNKEQLTWGDKTTSTEETAWNKTETTTYQFDILKYAAGDTSKKPLAGATFELYNNNHKDTDGNATLVKLVKESETEGAAGAVGTVVYRVATPEEIAAGTNVLTRFTTVENKKIVIKGVDLDEYYLKEIEAPPGFNLPKATFKAEVTGNSLTFEIENKSGAELPSTGGMGTTLFYLLGSVMVVSAGVLLVTKRRMAK